MDHQDEYIESDLEDDPRVKHGVNKENPAKNNVLTRGVETSSTLFMDIISDDKLCEDFEKGDPTNSLEINICDFLHIEERKWDMSSHHFERI